MSLSLKAQLEALAKKTPKLAETRKASILFNEKELESVDTETIFNIATNGLLKLIKIDERFTQFQSTLFTRHSLSFNRELQTEAENKSLNKTLNTFLKLISLHLMTKEAGKVLEYLIRKYNIQRYNTEEFLKAVLPYHATHLFSRIIKVLVITDRRFNFITGAGKTNEGLPRNMIVQECIKNPSVLSYIAEICMEYNKENIFSKMHVKLYVSTVTEVISQTSKVSDSMLTKLLPTILDGLKCLYFRDYFVGTLMVLSQISAKVPLSDDLNIVVLKIINSRFTKSLSRELTIFLIHFCQSQDIQTIPADLLSNIIDHSFSFLVNYQTKFNISKFITLLIHSLIECSFTPNLHLSSKKSTHSDDNGDDDAIEEDEDEDDQMQEDTEGDVEMEGDNDNTTQSNTSKKSPLRNEIRAKFSEFLQQFKASFDIQLVSKTLIDKFLLDPSLILEIKKFRSVYPKQIEELITDRLEELRKDPFSNQIFIDLLVNLPWMKLKETTLGETGTSLFLSLHAPDHQTRLLSTRKLIEEFTSSTSKGGSNNNEEYQMFFVESIMERIDDENPEVVTAALSAVKDVSILPTQQLFSLLIRVYDRFPFKTNLKKQIIHILAYPFLKHNPTYFLAIGDFFFSRLLSYSASKENQVKPLYDCLFTRAIGNYALFEGLPGLLSTQQLKDLSFHDLQSTLFSKILQNLLSFSESEIQQFLQPTHTDDNNNNATRGSGSGRDSSDDRSSSADSPSRSRNISEPILFFLSLSLTKNNTPLLMCSKLLAVHIEAFFHQIISHLCQGGEQLHPKSQLFFSLQTLEEKLLFTLNTCIRIFTAFSQSNSQPPAAPQPSSPQKTKKKSNNNNNNNPNVDVTKAGSALGTEEWSIIRRLFKCLISVPYLSYVKDAIEHLMSCFFSGNNSAQLFDFLSNGWMDDSVNHKLLRVRCLNLANISIDNYNHEFQQSTLPSLLVSLSSHEKAERIAGMSCILKLHNVISTSLGNSSPTKKSSNSLKTSMISNSEIDHILQYLIDHKERITIDHTQIQLLLGEYLQTNTNQTIHRFFIHHALHIDNLYAKKTLLHQIITSHSLPILQQTLSILKTWQIPGAETATHSNDDLNHIKAIFSLLLQLFSPEMALKLTAKDEEIIKILMNFIFLFDRPANTPSFLDSLLSDVRLQFLQSLYHEIGNDKSSSSSSSSSSFILNLNNKLQQVMFDCIISYNRSNIEFTEICQNLLRDIAWPTSFFVDEIEKINSSSTNDLSKSKKSKSSKATSEIDSSTLKISTLSATSFQKFFWVIELFPHKTNFQEPLLLIKPLFGLIGNLLATSGDDKLASLDYSIQQILQSITTLTISVIVKIEPKLASDNDIEIDDNNQMEISNDDDFKGSNNIIIINSSSNLELKGNLRNQIDIEKILLCLQVSKNSLTHTKALILLSKLAILFPEQVARHIMPIFSFMGDISVNQDDNYTFQVLHRVIQSIIPRLQDKNFSYVLPIIQIFIEPLYNIPIHRRLPLFTIFLKSLETKYASHVFFMLLVTHSFGPSSLLISKDGSENSISTFCSLLALQISPVLVIQIFCELIMLIETFQGASKGKSASSSSSASSASTSSSSDHQHHHHGSALKWKESVGLLQSISAVYSITNFYTLKTVIFSLMKEYLLDNNFLKKAMTLPSKFRQFLQTQYMSLFEKIMVQTRVALSLQHKETEKLKLEQCKTILSTIYPIISRLNEVLKLKYFVKVIIQLIDHFDPQIRRKSLLMLNDKIQSLDGKFSADQISLFIDLLSKITTLITKKSENEEIAIAKQTALYSAEILARHFGEYDPEAFLSSFPSIIQCLKDSEPQIASSAMICIATYCIHLGPRILSHLPQFFPLLLDVLFISLNSSSIQGLMTISSLTLLSSKRDTKLLQSGINSPQTTKLHSNNSSNSSSGDDGDDTSMNINNMEIDASSSEENDNWLLQVSGMSALGIIVEHLHQFLNPYLQDLLLLIIHPKLITSPNKQIKSKTDQLAILIAQNIDTRLILGPISTLYHSLITSIPSSSSSSSSSSKSITLKKTKLLAEEVKFSVLKLLDLFSIVCSEIPRAKVTSYFAHVFRFFIVLFNFRSNAYQVWYQNGYRDLESENRIASHIISAFTHFVLKLNEYLFKPLFVKVIHWNSAPHKNIAKFSLFIQLVDHLSATLKSIFVPYFAFFFDDLLKLLDNPDDLNEEAQNKEQDDAELLDTSIRYGVSSLTKCFEYGRQFKKDDKLREKFLNKERFDALLPVLVSLLERRFLECPQTYSSTLSSLVLCFTQMAVHVDNVQLWKTMQYQILLKTRSNLPKVRYGALLVIQALYRELAERFLPLLPEAIPFISELMEDSNNEVEQLCQQTISEINQMMGDEKIEDFL